jgi:hypothetical protein
VTARAEGLRQVFLESKIYHFIEVSGRPAAPDFCDMQKKNDEGKNVANYK